MIKFLKRLFSKKPNHVWKTTKVEFLRTGEYSSSVGGCVDEYHYKRYAHHQTCVKCSEDRIIELHYGTEVS